MKGFNDETRPQPFGRQLSRRGAGKIPVTVVTGFLGSGKSTLIKAFLSTQQGAGTALIVNEFGEIGIDDALLREGSERTVLMGNGCLCCLSGTDLQLTLRNLFAERMSGSLLDFQRVIIETSGLADPSPILQTLAGDRTLDKHYFLEGMVTVVDAATALNTAQFAPEWSKQVALADRTVLSKTDIVGEAELERVQAVVRGLAPFAPMKTTQDCRVDPAFLVGNSPELKDAERRSTFLCEDIVPERQVHPQTYNTFTINFEHALPWPVFSQAMTTLASLRGPDLLRVKGFINVVGRPGPVVVHFVQHLTHQPEELRAWPTEDRSTRLVFITRNLEKKRVEQLLDAFISVMDTENFR